MRSLMYVLRTIVLRLAGQKSLRGTRRHPHQQIAEVQQNGAEQSADECGDDETLVTRCVPANQSTSSDERRTCIGGTLRNRLLR